MAHPNHQRFDGEVRMNIQRLILRKLREECVGRLSAIKMKDLLDWLYDEGAFICGVTKLTTANRETREAIEIMPIICSCESGYYLVREGEEGYEDVKYAIKYIEKKAMPLLVKMRRKKEAYPQFFKGDQGDLFDED